MLPFGSHIGAGGISAPTPQFTPWQSRGGNAAVFVVNVLEFQLATPPNKIVVTVQSKNTEDPDASGTSQDVGAFDDITAMPSSPRTKYLSGFKELYRYKIEVFGDPSDDWVRLRMLSPSWLPN